MNCMLIVEKVENMNKQKKSFSIQSPSPRKEFTNLSIMTFWAGESFVVRTVLCIAGSLESSLASTHQMPLAHGPHIWSNKKCDQILLYVPWDQNHSQWEPLL